MNIQVRVIARQAQSQLAMIQRQTRGLSTESAMASAAASKVGAAAVPSLRKWGSQLQWAGRQLQYNFTLPIVAATALATKFALDNQAAMVRIQKVYGDASTSTRQMRVETQALGKAFRVLSDYYGVQQKEVLNIAADWAAAGVSGAALAKVTKITLDTMILGEMNAADATKALIQIQAQYGMSTRDLTKTISILNMVENQTGTSFEDLIVALSKSAGTARTAGLDIRTLSADVAALVPAAGTAAQAGNALKTIFSRILAPTSQASSLMKIVGINTNSAAWASTNAQGRLILLAQAFDKATHSQKAQLTTTVAGRYQLNRFDVLLRALTNHNSYYWKALQATASQTNNYKQEQKELNQVLDSNPQKFKQIMVMLQNMASDIIAPLIPLILSFANGLKTMVSWFTDLDPRIQKLIGTFLLLLAVFGPIIRYVGAMATALSLLGPVLAFLGKALISPFMGVWKVLSGTVSLFYTAGAGMIRGLMPVVTFMADVFLAMFSSSLAKLRVIFTAGFAALSRVASLAMTGIGVFLINVWTRTIAGMRAITTMAGPLIGGAFTKFFVLLGGIMTSGVTGLMKLWEFLTVGLRTVWAVTTDAITLIWSRTMFGLTRANLFSGVISVFQGFGKGLIALSSGIGSGILKAFTRPWILIAIGIIAIISAMRDKIVAVWNNIVKSASHIPQGIANAFKPIVGFFGNIVKYVIRAFDALPEGIRNAIMAVVNLVAAGAKEVYKLFSYLNPFAHHSPSLVENVTGGMNIVRNEHEKTARSAVTHTKTVANAHAQMTNTVSTANRSTSSSSLDVTPTQINGVDQAIKTATADIAKFRSAAKGMIPSEWADEIADIKKGMPSLMPLFNKLLHDLDLLNAKARAQAALVAQQQSVVNAWKSKLNDANKALDTQRDKLSQLQKQLSQSQSKYDAAKNALENYANAPIKGMQEFNDKLFANSEAQKKVQLQMDLWEQKNGSIDQLNDKFAKLNGEISSLQGEASALRAKGAGSDILGPIQQQIGSLQAQAGAVQTTIANSPIDKLQDQMNKLQQQGEILQLQNDIKFDPLEHQIEKLTNTTKELTYKQIIDGIQKSRKTMTQLTPIIDRQTKAVNDQKKVVEQATKARDKIQARYDAENNKLKALQANYQKTADEISKVKDALDAVGQAASTASSKADKSATSIGGAYANAGKGDYAEVGGKSTLGREGGVGAIDKFTQEQQKDLAKQLGGFDMFGPFKDMWKKGWAWIVKYIGPIFKTILAIIKGSFKIIGGAISSLFHGGSGSLGQLGTIFKTVFGTIASIIHGVANVFKLFWPDIKNVFIALGNAAMQIWHELVPALLKLWNSIKPLVAILIGALLGSVKLIASIFSNTLGPALNFVIHIISDVVKVVSGIAEVFGGIFNFLKDLFTGKWGKLWGDVKQIFTGVWDTIKGTFLAVWHVIDGVFNVIVGVVKGFVNGIVGFFKWLWNVLVGHSIVPDLMKAILGWFQWLLKPVIWVMQLLWKGIKAAWDLITTVFKLAWNFIKTVFLVAWNTLQLLIVDPIKVAWSILKTVWVWIETVFKNVWDWIKTVFASAWATLKTIIITPIKVAWSTLKTVWSLIQSVFSAAWNWIKNVFKSAWSGAKEIVLAPIRAAYGFLSSIWNSIKGVFNSAWNWIKNTFSSIWNRVKNIILTPIRAGRDAIVSVFKNLWNNISKAVSSFKSFLSSAWNAIKKIFGTPVWAVAHFILKPLIEGLNYIPGVNISTKWIDKIPHYSKGGKVPGSHDKDNVPIYVTPGEVVVPKRIVNAAGGASSLMDSLGFRGAGYNKNNSNFSKDASNVASASNKVNASLSADKKPKPPPYIIDPYEPILTLLKKVRDPKMKAILMQGLHGGNVGLGISFAWVDGIVDWVHGAIDEVEHLLRKGAAEAFMAAVGNPLKSADNSLDALGPFGVSMDHALDSWIDDAYRWIAGIEKKDVEKAKKMGGNLGNHKMFMDTALHDARVMVTSSIEDALNIIITNESGWNPKAINLTDSNAKAGHPSKGLMQTIPSTFESYRLKSLPDDIWNPLANAVAGIRYADANYGSLNNVPGVKAVRAGQKYVGYSLGTLNARGGPSLVGENGPELLNLPYGSKVYNNSTMTRTIGTVAGRVAARIAAPQPGSTAAAVAGPVTNNTTNNRVVNVRVAKVVLPNIKSGDDAETLLANLESLGDGSL